jgi:hypothetical protein
MIRATSGQVYNSSKAALDHANHKKTVIISKETSMAMPIIKIRATHIIRNTARMVEGTVLRILKTTLGKGANMVIITILILIRAVGPMMTCGSITESCRQLWKQESY